MFFTPFRAASITGDEVNGGDKEERGNGGKEVVLQWLRDGLLLLLVFVAIELIADEHKSTGTRISFPHGTPTDYRPQLNRFCCLNLSKIKNTEFLSVAMLLSKV